MANVQKIAGAASPVRCLRPLAGALTAVLVVLLAAACVPVPAPAASTGAGATGAEDKISAAPDTVAIAAAAANGDCQAEKVTVTDLSWFRDSGGAWHVAGWIQNQWDQPVSKIVTDVEALNAAGEVIDHGEDISAYPLNLKPGGQAPFIAWIKRDFPGTERFQVAVDECVVAETRERAAVEVRKDALMFDAAGRAQITGELVNTGAKPVLVNGLAGTILNAAGKPIAAGEGAVSKRYLGPGERGPLRVTLEIAPAGAKAASSYRLFMDAVVTDARQELIDAIRDLQVTSRYIDSDGGLHVVGTVANRGATSISLRLQGTLYDDAAKAKVVDAAYLDTPLPLAPGETRVFDLADWGQTVSPAIAAGEDKRAIELSTDLFDSWTDTAAPQPLTVTKMHYAFTPVGSPEHATFTGAVKNDSGKTVTSVVVTTALRKAGSAGGPVLATARTAISAAAGAAPGATIPFSTTVALPAGLSPDKVEASVTALAR